MMHIWPYLYAMENQIEDVDIVIRAWEDLHECPPFRRCKSRKWQRRRNKQFYRIMDGLKREGVSASTSHVIESGWV